VDEKATGIGWFSPIAWLKRYEEVDSYPSLWSCFEFFFLTWVNGSAGTFRLPGEIFEVGAYFCVLNERGWTLGGCFLMSL
jgi:hypothetical protein